MKKIISLGAVFGSIVPVFAFAANEGGVGSILGVIAGLLNIILPILIAFAVVYFVWNVIQYTISGDDKKKGDAAKGIRQGLIGLFVIIAFWGIIALVMNTFDFEKGLGGETVPFIPMPGDTYAPDTY